MWIPQIWWSSSGFSPYMLCVCWCAMSTCQPIRALVISIITVRSCRLKPLSHTCLTCVGIYSKRPLLLLFSLLWQNSDKSHLRKISFVGLWGCSRSPRRLVALPLCRAKRAEGWHSACSLLSFGLGHRSSRWFRLHSGWFSSLISASAGKPSQALLEVSPIDSADTITLKNKSRQFNIIVYSLLTGV